MGSDNYMYVQKHEDKYLVTMEFSSSPEVTDPATVANHVGYDWKDTLGDALEFAYRYDETEYGVWVSPEVKKEMVDKLKS